MGPSTPACQALPLDLQAKCLGYLSARERIVTAARVCRAWKALVCDSGLLWDRLELWLGTDKGSGTGRFTSLLRDLRRKGACTVELELVLGEQCLNGAWKGFGLTALLDAFPRLQCLRLIQTPLTGRAGSPFSDDWTASVTASQLDKLCQACPRLVDLAVSPLAGADGQLDAAVASLLQRLPDLRRLSMAVGLQTWLVAHMPRTRLRCLTTLTQVEELRCLVHVKGDPSRTVKTDFPDFSTNSNLQTLELTGLGQYFNDVQGVLATGSALPPNLTRLSVEVPSWETLPELSTLPLQSLSLYLMKPVQGYDLCSERCLTRLTNLLLDSRSGDFTPERHDGPGFVLPLVQRLTLSTGVSPRLPGVIDWQSLASLTYLCLKNRGYCDDEAKMDFQPLPKLRSLILWGVRYDHRHLRFPSSLTGLQLERDDKPLQLPEHLAHATGLRRLVLLGCHVPDTRDASFADTLGRLSSLTSFHMYVFKQSAYVAPGHQVADPPRAIEEWAMTVKHELRDLLPLVTCTVSLQGVWDRDGSGWPAACLQRSGNADHLATLLRVPQSKWAAA